MRKFNLQNIGKHRIGVKPIVAIYKGVTEIWTDSNSAFDSGGFNNEKGWSNNDGWKN